MKTFSPPPPPFPPQSVKEEWGCGEKHIKSVADGRQGIGGACLDMFCCFFTFHNVHILVVKAVRAGWYMREHHVSQYHNVRV